MDLFRKYKTIAGHRCPSQNTFCLRANNMRSCTLMDKHPIRCSPIIKIYNPNIIAICLGLLSFIYSWQLPEFLRLSIDAGKNLTTPLSLLAIGFLLSLTKNWREILSQRQLFFTCLLQLLLMPTTTFLLLYCLHAPETMILMFTMIQALPTATSLVIFSEKYHSDKKEAAKLVLISTLLSLLTLPVVMTAAICILTF